MTATLRAESVSFAYEPGRPVFNSVNASVAGGETIGLVGPNGSGKSTLLRVMCGLLRPQGGGVLLNGKPLAGYPGRDRARRVAFLPQAVNPAFALSVFEVVCLGRYPHTGAFGALGPRDKEAAERCMRDTEVEHLRARDFLTLSGGERQRVLLASILAQEPEILLLDEPTSALDIHHQTEIFSLLDRLAHGRQGGYGILVVTHDLNLAARFCDRILLMGLDHSMLAEGPHDSVLTEPLLSRAYRAPIRVSRHPETGAHLIWADAPREESGTPPTKAGGRPNGDAP
jgi:iron complex transport system ATP-binding protein